ncbi:hypothetical protein K0B96_03140 [Horticoccus luteus]|uniref:Uncharacterized protein n=1 Tax=Horticoccus luteus TaxID=2862869 RepID=A0A8F9XKF0_9BACT|nr:hypothetical protein [Horticoccus luteus]QYM79628.1 hypothetical protein K0B96_03140 [Horticoccus luteus]
MKKSLFWRLGGGLLLLSAGWLPAQDTLDIGVRSSIELPTWKRPKPGTMPAADAQEGRLFILAPPERIHSLEKLVRPVNTEPLVEELWRQLVAHGFQPAAPGQTPDIVVTLHYGRGYLRNPYIDSYASAVDESTSTPTVMITVPTIDVKKIGMEEKIQRAQYEKLLLAVTAWKYVKPEAGRKQKPVRLWRTTILVDDPDHRDLNELAARMLNAGAGYFNSDVDKEAEIHEPMREGRVEMGEPVEVKRHENSTK